MTPPDWQSLLFVPAGVEKHLASAIRLRPDAIILDLAATDAIIVPKCDGVRGLENAAAMTGGTIALIALIESPGALAHLTDIAAMPVCAGLMIGSEDYAANLGVDPNGGRWCMWRPCWGSRLADAGF